MPKTINAGYPKDGTPASQAHWAKVRAGLPRFTYDPPKTTTITVPVEHADEVYRLLARLRG
jgi:hypothetical protein